MKRRILIQVLMVCTLVAASVMIAACSNLIQPTWPIEALTADEFAYYADNANVFADSVLESGAKFLYVQLACAADSSLSEDNMSVANDNADGITMMLKNDYHDVLDAREGVQDVVAAIGRKLALAADSRILVIGDAAGELQIYEELAKNYNNIDYLNSVGVSADDYDKIYDNASTAGWDAVIVANDVAAFHAQSFPFAVD